MWRFSIGAQIDAIESIASILIPILKLIEMLLEFTLHFSSLAYLFYTAVRLLFFYWSFPEGKS